MKAVLVKALALSAALAASTAHAKTVTIAIDLSGSNPLLVSAEFAAGAADYAARRIAQLEDGDKVRIKTFGARGSAANALDQVLEISRRQRAPKVAAQVQRFTSSLPQQQAKAQAATNIIATLEFDSGLDCAGGGEVLLLTDGVESSEYVNAQRFAAARQKLPKPDVDLKGCRVTFYGLGAGLPAPSAKFIRGEWNAWIAAAGAEFSSEIK